MSNIADIIRMNSLTDERNAARAENKLLKARIAAVEAAHFRMHGYCCDEKGCDIAAVLAASPTPTGSETATTCEHESHAYIGEQRVGSFRELDGNRWAPCSATPTGPEPATCEHGLIRCAVCGTDVPATPEPTEETP